LFVNTEATPFTTLHMYIFIERLLNLNVTPCTTPHLTPSSEDDSGSSLQRQQHRWTSTSSGLHEHAYNNLVVHLGLYNTISPGLQLPRSAPLRHQGHRQQTYSQLRHHTSINRIPQPPLPTPLC
jgi:hypothetical protein